MKLHRLILSAILGVLALSPAFASPVTYDFLTGPNTNGNSFGNILTYTVSGVTLTATAWGVTGPPSDTTFQSAELVANISGLGMCDRSEGVGCSGLSDPAQIDNLGPYDFVMFQFLSPVDFSSITIDAVSWVDGRDVSYSVCANAVNPADLTGHSASGTCGSFTTINNASGTSALTIPLTGTGNTLLFGAADPSSQYCYVNHVTCDGFNIDNLTVDSEAAVPEPASLVLMGLGLVGLGLVRRVKKL